MARYNKEYYIEIESDKADELKGTQVNVASRPTPQTYSGLFLLLLLLFSEKNSSTPLLRIKFLYRVMERNRYWNDHYR